MTEQAAVYETGPLRSGSDTEQELVNLIAYRDRLRVELEDVEMLIEHIAANRPDTRRGANGPGG